MLEFVDYFEEVESQVPVKRVLSNDQARLLIDQAYYRNLITEQGYVGMLRELGFYA